MTFRYHWYGRPRVATPDVSATGLGGASADDYCAGHDKAAPAVKLCLANGCPVLVPYPTAFCADCLADEATEPRASVPLDLGGIEERHPVAASILGAGLAVFNFADAIAARVEPVERRVRAFVDRVHDVITLLTVGLGNESGDER